MTTDTTPDDTAARLAQIRDRNRRLAAVPWDIHDGTHGPACIPCELVRAVGDVNWLLEQLGSAKVEWRAHYPSGAWNMSHGMPTESVARQVVEAERGMGRSKVELQRRLVGEWKAAEQQPEDGDRG